MSFNADELLGEFLAETEEMLEAISGELVAWEADPSERTRLDSIFRFVHTVKGNCGLFDFPRLQALSHAAEDALADVRAGRRVPDAGLVTAILAIIDRIGNFVAAIREGTTIPEGGDDSLIASLLLTDENLETVNLGAAHVEDGDRKAPGGKQSLRLSVELLDQMMNCVSNIVLSRNEMAHQLKETDAPQSVVATFKRLSNQIADLRDSTSDARMQPIARLFGALPRLVRDLSTQLGKQVMIDIEGDDVEFDREMVELLRDPLAHIIRNAIDHGIEHPSARLAAGKREIGCLTVTARRIGNQIQVDVTDDGRGIDIARVVDKAVEAGLISQAGAAELSPGDRLMLVCHPGLSTAHEVTEISGRGVGMDVVRANIERIGGQLKIASSPGESTCVSLRVPLTLAITPALVVEVAGQQFVIPRSVIREVVDRGSPDVEFSSLGGVAIVRVRNKRLPCISLTHLLQIDAPAPSTAGVLMVLQLGQSFSYALIVDRITNHQEFAIRPASPPVMAAGIYAGITISEEGRPLLLLDTTPLAHAGGVTTEILEALQGQTHEVASETTVEADQCLILSGLDGRPKALRLDAVRRITTVLPEAVDFNESGALAVIEDQLIPLVGITRDALGSDPVNVAMIDDGDCLLAYAFAQVIELGALTDEILPSCEPGPVEGTTIVNGHAVEVIDAHWLFAEYGVGAAETAQPVCRIQGSDTWTQKFLRPIIEANGYRVVIDTDPEAADVVVVSDELAEPSHDEATVIRLSRSKAQAPGSEGRMYRYDRKAIVQALQDAKVRRAI